MVLTHVSPAELRMSQLNKKTGPPNPKVGRPGARKRNSNDAAILCAGLIVF